MDRKAVEVVVAGQKVRVVSTASEDELRALARSVTARVEGAGGRGRSSTPQALVLAALGLAHELETERARRREAERKARDSLRRVLVRVDQLLEASGGER